MSKLLAQSRLIPDHSNLLPSGPARQIHGQERVQIAAQPVPQLANGVGLQNPQRTHLPRRKCS